MFVVDVVNGSVLIPIVCLVGDTTGEGWDECRFIRLAMDGNGEICCCGGCKCELVPFVNISTISYRISVIGVKDRLSFVRELIFVNKLHGSSRWRCLATVKSSKFSERDVLLIGNVCNKFVVGIDCNFRLNGFDLWRVDDSFRLFDKVFGSITSEERRIRVIKKT